MLKTIIFDFDGTLVDSEQFHFDCWNETLAEFDIKIDEKEYLKEYAGVPTPANAVKIVAKHALDISSDILVKKREELGSFNASRRTPVLMPHADEVIKIIFAHGIQLGIVTGSPRTDVELFFDKTIYRQYFDFVVTRDDVKHSKPDPECYLVGLSHSHGNRMETIVFEDTANGITSATNANLACYAVQRDVNFHSQLEHARKTFYDLSEAMDFVYHHYNIT